MPGESDWHALIDAASGEVGLPIAPEYRHGVIAHYQQTCIIVEPLLAFELGDEVTLMPVFKA